LQANLILTVLIEATFIKEYANPLVDHYIETSSYKFCLQGERIKDNAQTLFDKAVLDEETFQDFQIMLQQG
jgi:hypothetical protein